jgi:hypothetical protein
VKQKINLTSSDLLLNYDKVLLCTSGLSGRSDPCLRLTFGRKSGQLAPFDPLWNRSMILFYVFCAHGTYLLLNGAMDEKAVATRNLANDAGMGRSAQVSRTANGSKFNNDN